MERRATRELLDWIARPDRKPLVLRGARQVGKTWLAREVSGRSGLTLMELNFERDPQAAALFDVADPRAVMRGVEAYLGRRARPKETILFLDEIQAAPEVLARLRWFAEELPELPVVAAGSLLDFALADHRFSMPVGRISYLHLEPMSFEEFLAAANEDSLLEWVRTATLGHPIPLPLHERLLDLLRDYMLVGGLPAAVQAWCHERSYLEVSRVQQDLLATYRDDFARYAGRVPVRRLDRVLTAVPRLLGRKFMYSQVDPEQRAAALRQALDLLCKARLCHRVQASDSTGVPLGAEVRERTFKVVLADVGLASAALGLSPRSLRSLRSLRAAELVNEGGLAEQLVGQALRGSELSFIEPALYYWTRRKHGAQAEVDYVIQHDTSVVPVEVKAGTTGRLRSLHLFMARRGLPLAVRLAAHPASLVDVQARTATGHEARYQLLSLPLYLAGQLPRWLDEVDGV
ncbi:MAG: ATP-binding protein [Myxococcota bacterium]|jgi:hypothetical protein|nr:ATP-binding protein [Myxococcota bacterium]